MGAGFHSELNGRENIVLNGILLGLTRREVVERDGRDHRLLRVGRLHRRSAADLFDGHDVAAGILGRRAPDPSILLVDEALAVGDQAFRQKCLRRMQQFRQQGTTMVFVSHDMESVARISDRVALVIAGRARRDWRARAESSTATERESSPPRAFADATRPAIARLPDDAQSQASIPRTCRSNRQNCGAPTKRLDMAVIIPELAKYGGAERFLIECVARWQDVHDMTIYSSNFNTDLLAEHGIEPQSSSCQDSFRATSKDSTRSCSTRRLLPKIWEQEIGKHDVYHTHLWPTHLIDLHPMVWFPHEPLRILHDLRYEQPLGRRGRHAEARAARLSQVQLRLRGRRHLRGLPVVMDLVDKLGKPDRVVANSRYSAGYLEGVYGSPVHDVVYPGVNVDDFIFQPSDENIFLTIGQLWPHKRIKLIIEALKLVENAQLYIVGSGPEKAKAPADRRGHGAGKPRLLLARADESGSQDSLLAGAWPSCSCPSKSRSASWPWRPWRPASR